MMSELACRDFQGALKGTNLRGQTEPQRGFSLIFADSGEAGGLLSTPYSIQKRPEPQICPKFVTAIVFGGSSQGVKNLKKIVKS